MTGELRSWKGNELNCTVSSGSFWCKDEVARGKRIPCWVIK
jgi:hypothetical protein